MLSHRHRIMLYCVYATLKKLTNRCLEVHDDNKNCYTFTDGSVLHISIVFCSGTAHIVLQFTGVVITMFGVLAFIVSVTQMKENWRAGVQKEEKTNLVTTGIYSISRNPAFLGFDLMYIGILFSFFNWFLCFATGFAVVFFHLQIVNVEEDFLIKAFGNEYLQYKSKVCRYLGRKR